MLERRLCTLLAALGLSACSVTSETPLLDPDSALPLRGALDETIDFVMPDNDSGALTLRGAEDGRTLLLVDPEKPQDGVTRVTFHTLPDRDGQLIAQGDSDSTRPGMAPYGYAFGACTPEGLLVIYDYDIQDILAQGPIEGIVTNGNYVPEATSAAGLHGFFQAILKTAPLETLEIQPDIPCAMIFE